MSYLDAFVPEIAERKRKFNRDNLGVLSNIDFGYVKKFIIVKFEGSNDLAVYPNKIGREYYMFDTEEFGDFYETSLKLELSGDEVQALVRTDFLKYLEDLMVNSVAEYEN
jgi:hypothetical protein